MEARRQSAGGVTQQVLDGPDSHDQAAHFNEMLGQGFVANQDAGGFAASADALESIVDCGHHLGVLGIAQITHVGRQVARANKHAVDAFDVGNVFQMLEAFDGFNLQQQADFFRAALGQVFDAALAAGPGVSLNQL